MLWQSPLCRRAWMKSSLKGGLALATLTALPAQAEINSLNEAINKAGRQRMLSQRMAKAWLAVGQEIDAERAEKILLESMALFDRQFVELKAYAPSSEIRRTYLAMEPLWSDYKSALIGSTPERNSALNLLALDAQVLKLSHQGTEQLEQYSGRAVGKLVNLAGRQRMLSQRTAKFYLSQNWGAPVPNALKELNKARTEFVTALQTLMNAPQATEAIRQQLGLAEQQWVFFDQALSRLGEGSGGVRRARDVFSTSEQILQIMDKVTGLYSRLA
ncbi:type IV pili methyl-accepting chemotaxis transducer N-terminal domain-containing protein [Aquabacterium sp. CECT 9606]|uniref:type IV pili methyl-accepting chemotaxis transducer N-terminal domain-containing protein n=1 Tax=Aquabacterium sp. CECT 9606 TaxID=2845822 RepID=UPI001E2AE025|nr:type IV pili methyl-accepting chemotaxis transducer N-terminal domain-containing protein [Aquabacterium sp. CECT 9606]CAH0353013.1 hypothetical protein AQB9606_03007 [Aquabacterium sp. CECT 9606]